MKVVIDIPNDFTGDYIVDKFKDFFSRVIADIDCKGMCGRYEKEIAEMFLKAFDDSEEKIPCNCQNNSNSRNNEPCCRCDSKHTKKPIFNHNLSDTLSVFHCECGNTIKVSHDIGIMNNNNAPNYCSKCGCKFDWSDEE
jgi:hypothetical protein